MKLNMHRLTTGLVLALFAVLVLQEALPSAVAQEAAYTAEECIECHNLGSEESGRLIDVDAFNASTHGAEITCLECHTGVVDDTHQTTEGSGAVDCGDCHEQENRHGLAGPEEQRPQCHGCHTRHQMLTRTDPASSVHPDRLTATCSECHPAASGKTGFFSWFPSFQISAHEKADFDTAYDESNCLGCHQGAAAHGESEPINEQDCHKCHLSPQAAGAMWGYTHPTSDLSSKPSVFVAASIYQAFFAVVLIGFLWKIINLISKRSPAKSKRQSSD